MEKEIYFAGGCFWGVEKYFASVPGVVGTCVGYANGNTAAPTYEDVCIRNTGHAEAVKVTYQPEEVPLKELAELYFEVIDPTALNRQGNDRGVQYRTGIYYTDKTDRDILVRVLAEEQKKHRKPVVVEVAPLKNFYQAEEYHQKYLDKNPEGYCHIGREAFERAGSGKAKFRKRPQKELKRVLTELQYQVTQNGCTERPFENEYFDEFRPGVYVDITTGEPLFVSSDKFDSGCGWPSFSKPIDRSLLEETEDLSHRMHRTEVRSKTGNAHLGHVFEDGPQETGGLRYCINSAALRFIPVEEMAEEGYQKYLPLVELKDEPVF